MLVIIHASERRKACLLLPTRRKHETNGCERDEHRRTLKQVNLKQQPATSYSKIQVLSIEKKLNANSMYKTKKVQQIIVTKLHFEICVSVWVFIYYLHGRLTKCTLPTS